MYTYTFLCLMQHDDEILQWRKRFATKITSIRLAQQNRETCPKIRSGKLLRTICQVVFENEHFFHFDCLKTTDGLTQAGYMPWSAVIVLYSYRYWLFIDITELCGIATIDQYFHVGRMTFQSVCVMHNTIYIHRSFTTRQRHSADMCQCTYLIHTCLILKRRHGGK